MHLNYHLAYHQTSSIYVRFNVFVVIFIMDQWAMCMYFSSPYSHQNMNLFISSAFACITVPFQHNNKIYSVKKITWVTNYKNETSQLAIIMIIPITILYRSHGEIWFQRNLSQTKWSKFNQKWKNICFSTQCSFNPIPSN